MAWIRITLLRTIALVLAMSLGLAGIASASVSHASHCLPATEQADADYVAFDIKKNDVKHGHVGAEVETTNLGATDCMPHYCSAVLNGLAGYGCESQSARLIVVPGSENLRAMARVLGLYRPPSV